MLRNATGIFPVETAVTVSQHTTIARTALQYSSSIDTVRRGVGPTFAVVNKATCWAKRQESAYSAVSGSAIFVMISL